MGKPKNARLAKFAAAHVYFVAAEICLDLLKSRPSSIQKKIFWNQEKFIPQVMGQVAEHPFWVKMTLGHPR